MIDHCAFEKRLQCMLMSDTELSAFTTDSTGGDAMLEALGPRA